MVPYLLVHPPIHIPNHLPNHQDNAQDIRINHSDANADAAFDDREMVLQVERAGDESEQFVLKVRFT